MELEEIKRNKHGNCDEQNGTVVVEEANDGNEHELPAENVKEMDPQTAQEAQVQSEGCDEAPRQLSEDQLVIWKRLNEIILSQDQGKVPALKKIVKRRIREELQVVEFVSSKCRMCGSHDETVQHILCSCPQNIKRGMVLLGGSFIGRCARNMELSAVTNGMSIPPKA